MSSAILAIGRGLPPQPARRAVKRRAPVIAKCVVMSPNSMFGTKSQVKRQSQKTKSIRAASPINWRQWVEFPGEEAFMARDGGWRGLCVFTCRKVWAKTKSDRRATSGRSSRPSGSHARDQRRPLTGKAHCVPKGGRSRAGRQVESGSPGADGRIGSPPPRSGCSHATP